MRTRCECECTGRVEHTHEKTWWKIQAILQAQIIENTEITEITTENHWKWESFGELRNYWKEERRVYGWCAMIKEMKIRSGNIFWTFQIPLDTLCLLCYYTWSPRPPFSSSSPPSPPSLFSISIYLFAVKKCRRRSPPCRSADVFSEQNSLQSRRWRCWCADGRCCRLRIHCKITRFHNVLCVCACVSVVLLLGFTQLVAIVFNESFSNGELSKKTINK